ncbi:hypothetical protein HZS_258 [Henneguya salminicola]|nr:hypothetical protein HZS_258 [Henneguya salminicola]
MSSLLALAAEKKRYPVDLTNKHRMIKVSNLPLAASKYQICTMFSFFGETDLAVIYPTDDDIMVENKIAFLRFTNPEHAAGAIHMTNTVYLDRPLIVTLVPDEKIPDEDTLMIESRRWSAMPNLEGLTVHGETPNTKLKLFMGYAHIPPEPNYDPSLPPLKISELIRTVYVHNLHYQATAESLLTLFSGIGEVKFVKVTPLPDSDKKYGLVEFTDLSSVPLALQYNDFSLWGLTIKSSYRPISSPDWKRNRQKREEEYQSRRRSPIRLPSPKKRSLEYFKLNHKRETTKIIKKDDQRRKRSRTRSISSSPHRRRSPIRLPSPKKRPLEYFKSNQNRETTKMIKREDQRRKRSRTLKKLDDQRQKRSRTRSISSSPHI